MATSGGIGLQAGGMAGVISDPRQAAPGMDDGSEQQNPPKDQEVDPKEEAIVKKWWKKYTDGRKFDENFRKQIAIDRRYAAGTSDLSWAVTTNLIGAFIDILVALLYARDPDVSVTKAAQVDNSGPTMPAGPPGMPPPPPSGGTDDPRQMELFARTLQIVISKLWKRGKLKKAARKGVRSVLSNAEGWFKCLMVSEKDPNGEVTRALNDAKELHEHLVAQQKLIEDPDGTDPETLEAEIAEKAALMATLEEKLELAITKMFVIDFVPTEYMQVSPDVAQISDHLDAEWNSNELYLNKDDTLARFPRLTVEDLKSAMIYYQKPPQELTTRDIDNVLPQGMLTAESAQAFVTSISSPESPPMYRVVEIWDRVDRTIRTMVDGVKKWAKEPYAPPYPTSRFYPYFYFAFYEVDGARHAQSLSWRLYKLQDEYSMTRSNFRITRERSIPGVLFNATGLDETEARKLQESKHQEYTALRPTDPATPLANLFAPKPVAAVDMRVFDPALILADMERLSGVQEALSAAISGPGNPKTATEANIQQSGTNARTNADRDSLEEMLTDLAQYTAEQALQCLSIKEAMQIAGPAAIWPEGMDIQDLFTLVEVQIAAGTTGKPRQGTDQQAWATLLPILQDLIGKIEMALAQGNLPLANSLTELIKETMLRLGDESDPDRFIPKVPPPGSPGSNPPPRPVTPTISISLKGELDPATAASLASPAVTQDQVASAAQNAALTPNVPGVSAPGGTPAVPAAPAPGPGPITH